MRSPVRTVLARNFDVFVDLSCTTIDAETLVSYRDLLGSRTGLVPERHRVTIAIGECVAGLVPPPGTPTQLLAAALAAAAVGGRGLLVIQGVWVPNSEVVAALDELQQLDPMVGTIQPRFADPVDDSIIGLPSEATGEGRRLRRQALPLMPQTILTPELPAALFLITPQGVAAADVPREATISEALGKCLTSLRRRGFRNLVSNRVVTPLPLDAAVAYSPLSIPNTEGGGAIRDDLKHSRKWMSAAPEFALESVLAGAFNQEGQARLLLDCRGMPAFHNGTAHSMLGIIEGFRQLRQRAFQVVVLVSEAAAQFHGLAAHIDGLHLQLDRPSGTFLAAVHLSQPWSVETIAELHRVAAIIVFNVLDTIAWDIIYAAPEGLDRVWHLLAQLSDGLLFISDFSRQRFDFRFRPNPSIATEVMHLTMLTDELVSAMTENSPVAEPYLLIMGNNYDHKGVQSTLESLVDAFPYLSIMAIGIDATSSPRVKTFQSGHIEEQELDVLMANAAVVVFPSFYEGFGMPVVQALARGRAVIVRYSSLWEEIAGYSRLPGILIPFHSEIDLITAVGRAVHGQPLRSLPCGSSLCTDNQIPSWHNCAKTINNLVQRLSLACDGGRWITRESILGRNFPG